jgi:protein-tyrosine phosphatase
MSGSLSLALAASACGTASDRADTPNAAALHDAAKPRPVETDPSGAAGADHSPGLDGATGVDGAAGGSAPVGADGVAGAAGNAAESATCPGGNRVLVDDVTNARDLGGVPLAGGRHVACGVLYRGAPLRLSTDGCREFRGLRIRSVIDLRLESERSTTPDAACISSTRVNAPFPVPYGLSAADYLRVLHETASLAATFHALGDASLYPSYFHCTFGRDRTGVIAALVLLTLGATRETVMQEYLLSQPFVGAYPDALDAVLDEVEQRGGAEAVLLDAGVRPAELEVLRQHAVGN